MNKQGKQVKGEEVREPEESILGSCKCAQVIYFAQLKLSRPWPRELEKCYVCEALYTKYKGKNPEAVKYTIQNKMENTAQ